MGGKWPAFAFLILVLIGNAFAFSANGSEYELEKAILTEGGGNASGSEYSNDFSLGLLIGSLTGSEFVSDLGFYFAEAEPSITVIGPSGTISSTSVTLEIQTNIESTCKYDTSDVDYDSMNNGFSTSNNLYHSASLTLSEGSHTYYTRCESSEGVKNSASTVISFTISITEVAAPTGAGVGGGVAGAEYEAPREGYIEEFDDVDFILGFEESITFRSKGEDHVITILEFLENAVKIEINSPLILFDIFVGEEYDVDVDEDGVADVKLTLNEIENEEAHMSIKYLYTRDVLCGNGIVEEWETSDNCCFDAGCLNGFICIDNVCESSDCGNNICEEGETVNNCPEDCLLTARFVQSENVRRFFGGFVFLIMALLAVFAFFGYRRVIEREKRIVEGIEEKIKERIPTKRVEIEEVPEAPEFEVPELPGYRVPEEETVVPSHVEYEAQKERKVKLSEKGRKLMRPLSKVEEEMGDVSKRVRKEALEDGLIGEDYAKKKGLMTGLRNGWHYVKNKINGNKSGKIKSAGNRLRYSSKKFKKKIENL
jgi:hypothetical protein